MATFNSPSVNHADISGQQSLSLFLAGAITIAWILSLFWFLSINLHGPTTWIFFCGILLRTFLQTGLFIITHESIHGTLCKDRGLGQFVGFLTAILYACISYRTLFENHRLHHLYPSTERDPDFKGQGSRGFWAWYLHFVTQYYKSKYAWLSMVGMATVCGLIISLGISPAKIILFWLLPIVLSSLQLFYFGVYLPHRITDIPLQGIHQARSNDYPEFWSLITCYHFGYHLEHHQRPDVPWHCLPKIRQQSKSNNR